MKKKKYKVIDLMDCDDELIGIFDTKEEAKKAARQRARDTDGECIVHIAIIEEDQ